ncbi:superfamily II DNA and RNA helicase [Vibrio maritimus]|uniref:Superfamily II DNA and RNA helicase n=1 Tax=Vibrio maritimus TaxID=990268 RepID=A0A090S007_9VIBR|nr:superfamily II DNA and RNA helicase [Vibrio maritimus]
MLLNNQIRSQYNVSRTYNAFGSNIASQGIQDEVLEKLSKLTSRPQWILMTAECPRPSAGQALHFHKLGKHMVQMKPSASLTQYQVVEKAIRSGNACAIIANGQFSTQEQATLNALALSQQCEVVFLSGERYLH